MNIVLSSKAPKECFDALEKLLFFNPRQHLVRDGILDSLAQFGQPRLERLADGLSVRVGEIEAQTLFAFDQDRAGSEPVGVLVFLRTMPNEVAIVHVAVHPDYALQGQQAGLGLGVILVEKLKEICSRIVGVRQIVFYYRQEVVIRL